ncbi:unnamed protein product [marine sediment metagenome]|uniref:Uncharacterized protein n=1 Tax=marine sediment metagenome TaxID=412755 RepID=X1BDF1_9ZZZZ
MFFIKFTCTFFFSDGPGIFGLIDDVGDIPYGGVSSSPGDCNTSVIG